MSIVDMISELEVQREAIDDAIDGLRRLADAQNTATYQIGRTSVTSQTRSGFRNQPSIPQPTGAGRRQLTQEEKNKRSDAMKKTWERRRNQAPSAEKPADMNTDYAAQLAAAAHPEPEIPVVRVDLPNHHDGVEPAPPPEEKREEHGKQRGSKKVH